VLIGIRLKNSVKHQQIDSPGLKKKKFIYFSLPVMLHSLLYLSLTNVGVILAKLYIGNSGAGTYTAAHELAKGIGIFLAIIAPVFFTYISNLNQQKKFSTQFDLYGRVTNILIQLTGPIFILIILFPHEILNLFFNSNNISNDAVLALLILSLGYFIDVLIGPIDSFLNSIGKPNIVLRNSFIAFLLLAIIAIFSVNKFGIIGISVATTIAIIVQNILGLIFITRNKQRYKSFITGSILFKLIGLGGLLLLISLLLTNAVFLIISILLVFAVYYISCLPKIFKEMKDNSF
jgi:O-antigen/teichoic acid export membrane protein